MRGEMIDVMTEEMREGTTDVMIEEMTDETKGARTPEEMLPKIETGGQKEIMLRPKHQEFPKPFLR